MERENQLEELHAAVSELTARVTDAELCLSYHEQERAELNRLQAIAEETRKLEAREVRLVHRLEHLERGAGAGTRGLAREQTVESRLDEFADGADKGCR